MSDSRSMDILANSSSTWMRNVVHRNAQVAPEGIFLYPSEYILKALHYTANTNYLYHLLLSTIYHLDMIFSTHSIYYG